MLYSFHCAHQVTEEAEHTTVPTGTVNKRKLEKAADKNRRRYNRKRRRKRRKCTRKETGMG